MSAEGGQCVLTRADIADIAAGDNPFHPTNLFRSSGPIRLRPGAHPDAVFTFDLDLVYRGVNDAAVRMYGWQPEDLLGKPGGCHLDAEGAALLRDFLGQALRDGYTEPIESKRLRADGTTFYASLAAAQLLDTDHEVAGVALFCRNIDAIVALRDDLLAAQADLRYLAEHDPLTGLKNRRVFDAALEEHLAEIAAGGSVSGALLVLDLDHFKHQNDTYGHAKGDLVLREIALALVDVARPDDIIGRLGGDEFAILLPDGDIRAGEELAKRVVEAVEERATTIGLEPDRLVSASVGITDFVDHPSVDVAYLRADNAMYDAKRAGRAQWFSRAGKPQRP